MEAARLRSLCQHLSAADNKERGQLLDSPVYPGLGNNFGPDTRRIAQRYGEGAGERAQLYSM